MLKLEAPVHPKALVSKAYVCNLYDLGKTSVHELMAKGHLTPIKMGRRTVFALDQVLSLRDSIVSNGGIALS